MRILWLCNIMLPAVAKQLGVEASNKEGWLPDWQKLFWKTEGRVALNLLWRLRCRKI